MQIFYFYLMSGVILIALEIASTTFYLCVIGCVFILAAILSLFYVNGVVISFFALLLSILACIGLKAYKAAYRGKAQPLIAEHIGHSVEVVEIKPDKLRVKYSGSYWDAKFNSKDSSAVNIGDILFIRRYQNNEFEVVKEELK